jgi:hypothetical protein
MVRALSLLAIAGLLVLAQCCTPGAALSATLWDVSMTGDCSSSESRVVGSLTHLDSGQCVKVGQYGASVRCAADGQVTQAALYSDHDCSIVYFSGSGAGDGMSCIRLSSRSEPGFYFSTIVNCAAPGAEPGSCACVPALLHPRKTNKNKEESVSHCVSHWVLFAIVPSCALQPYLHQQRVASLRVA